MTSNVIVSAIAFFGALAATLVLTPVVREINRRFGMIDYPDERRVNTVPVPRGGGVAVFLGVFGVFALLRLAFGVDMPGKGTGHFMRILLLTGCIVAVGYADDKFSLKPIVKLAFQIAIAALTWRWADLGFADLWPALPAWLDCALTVFWIVGAINAFNLIDGLDGLATGLALVATVGMAGALCFARSVAETSFYFAFAGGLAGFLRYNYNPASVFLGDSGSMMLGYLLSVLPLCSHVPNSFMVSVGVPLLAMGLPIFDTFLAIVRRSIRRFLPGGGTSIMSADRDHVHHRILRAVGLNQRKAAVVMYVGAVFLVAAAIGAMVLKTRSGGLWLIAVAICSAVIFRDMARVEFFDLGCIANRVARHGGTAARRLRARLSTPILVVCDLVALVAVYFFSAYVMRFDGDVHVLRTGCLLRTVCVVASLIAFRAYSTVWARAMGANYMRLLAACIAGSLVSSAILYYMPDRADEYFVAFTTLYATLSYLLLSLIRCTRMIAVDVFYEMDCSRIVARKDVSRILVYGAGLRYRAFRRELVRSASENTRVIVGIIDDDVSIRGHYIGDAKICGTLSEAPDIINRLNVDAVVVACDIPEKKLAVVKAMLAPTGVKVTVFGFSERSI